MIMDLRMEVYSPALELLGILEVYRSIVWTQQAFTAGTFTLDALITEESRELLVRDNIIWISDDYAGVIERVHQQVDESGPYIEVKGWDLTKLLDRRILWGAYSLYDMPEAVMRYLVDDCAVHPTRGETAARIIPGLVIEDSYINSGAKIRKQKTGGSLLETLEEIGAAYQIAFGVRFNPDVPCMEFWTRPGVDRSVWQFDTDPVLYSTELDDVLSSEYVTDAGNWKNIALVAGEGEGSERVTTTVTEPVDQKNKYQSGVVGIGKIGLAKIGVKGFWV